MVPVGARRVERHRLLLSFRCCCGWCCCCCFHFFFLVQFSWYFIQKSLLLADIRADSETKLFFFTLPHAVSVTCHFVASGADPVLYRPKDAATVTLNGPAAWRLTRWQAPPPHLPSVAARLTNPRSHRLRPPPHCASLIYYCCQRSRSAATGHLYCCYP